MNFKPALTWLLLALVFLICWSSESFAQLPPLWGNLTPGPHAVGFKTIEKYDYSRTFQPKYDYFGNPLQNEIARPVQVCIWYPAQPADDAPSMVLGEYVFPNPEDVEFFRHVSGLQRRELGFLGALLNDAGVMLDIMNVPVMAVRDALPAEGQFYALAYFPGNGHAFCDNMVLSEFLASHGYVVVSVSFLGTGTYQPDNPAADLESHIQDMQFALSNLRNEEYIDRSRMGALGFGFGGAAALLLQMRDNRVDAVVDIMGADILSEYAATVAENPYFNIMRMIVPTLRIYSTADDQYDFALVDSCRYSVRYSVEFNNIPENGLTCYRSIVDLVSEDGTFKESVTHPYYDAATHYVQMFFDAYIKQSEQRLTDLKAGLNGQDYGIGEFTYRTVSADEIPPTTAQFLAIFQSSGPEQALELYDKFNKLEPGSITVPEATMNILGYQMLQTGQLENAVALFKINAETYPSSANVWDSYSDGLQAIGDNEKAIECYKKVLEVLPNDEQVTQQLREILQTNAEEGIQQLQSEN